LWLAKSFFVKKYYFLGRYINVRIQIYKMVQ